MQNQTSREGCNDSSLYQLFLLIISASGVLVRWGFDMLAAVASFEEQSGAKSLQTK